VRFGGPLISTASAGFAAIQFSETAQLSAQRSAQTM
jgi:hypothetical protein